MLAENFSKGEEFSWKNTLFVVICQIIFIVFALFLTQRSFFYDNNRFEAGVTVFSDLAPHTALVRNFGIGGNIPASYPHFADAGMNYHFFFYYLAGILNGLGMRLDFALNIPSALGTYTFMTLISLIAVALSKKIAAWGLVSFLFIFRSSLSGFYILFDDLRITGNLFTSIGNLYNSTSYSGPLLRDDWGLYNLNVYANQRHLLFVLAIAIWILIIFLPLLAQGDKEESKLTTNWSAVIGTSFIALSISYWHGSITIALDLILIIWALFSKEKLKYLVFGLTTVVGALLMLATFTRGEGALSTGNIFHWGYILEDISITSVLGFLLILFGLAFILMAINPFLQKKRNLKIITASLWLPVLFALTISLTPDVTVNHKFFMITQILFLPFVAELLLRLWHMGKNKWTQIGLRTLTASMIFILTFTGLTDFWTYKNVSVITTWANASDDFTLWLEENTEDNSVNLTPPWHYHSYYISGRQAWYGYSYYSSSAGYDTDARLEDIRWILSASPDAYTDIVSYLNANNLEYIFIDDYWRSSDEYYINENQLAEWFELAASFPEYGYLNIYKVN